MRFTIGRKISLGFFIIVLINLAVTLYTFVSVKNANDTYEALLNKEVRVVVQSSEMQASMLEKVASFRGYIINGDTKKLDSIEECDKAFNDYRASLDGLLVSPDAKAALKNMVDLNAEYDKLIGKIKELKRDNRESEIEALVSGEGARIIDRITKSAEEISTLAQKLLSDGQAEQISKGHSLIGTITNINIVTILLSVLFSLVIARFISKPLIKLSKAVDRIAEGDLNIEKIHVPNKDEVGQLAKSFNIMLENLRNVVLKVKSSSSQVAASAQELMAGSESASSAAEEISASAQNVAANVEKERENIDDISSTVNQLSAGVEQTAANMQKVSSSSQAIAGLSRKGQQDLDEVVRQMQAISGNSADSVNTVKALGDMSKAVEAVIDIITDISSQTNLLALNAAIEAARAGEQGKGFAVVAEEVRKLAEQSREAAVEISGTIKSMNNEIGNVIGVIEAGAVEVEKGREVVNEISRSFSEISERFESITVQVQEVSAAAQEMSAGTQEVVASIEEVAGSTDKNTASVEEVTAAIEEQTASMAEISDKAAALSNLAVELDEVVSVFKVE